MPFGLWTWMVPRNHVLDGMLPWQRILGRNLLSVAFWLLMGYNFGCMIPGDMQFDSRGWVFWVKLSSDDIADIECLRVQFWD